MEYSNVIGTEISIRKKINKHRLDYKSIINKFSKQKLIKVLSDMIKTRLFDEEIDLLIKEGTPITQHSTYGQEGSQTAACSLLKKNDYLQTNHRGWGWAIAKGLDLNLILAELIGRKTGYCQGKGGPHLADREHNLLLRSGIQGSYISLAAGVGLGLKMQGKRDVCLCLFGDGSSNAGYVHEGMNIAATNRLPVIYLCENNQYALFTPYRDTTSVEDIASRALGYDIPGYIVDGMDALAVMHVVSKAINRARNEEGPTLIETKTYRYTGHAANDRFYSGGYRAQEEIDWWKKRDPIQLYTEKLIDFKIISKKEIKEIENTTRENIQKAVQYAKESNYPDAEDYYKDVYAGQEVLSK